MAYTYRMAEGRDGTACAKIVEDWSKETPWLAPLWNSEKLIDWWSGCLQHVETSWVGEMNNEVVGFCVREDDNITGLYVSRDARGSGIGKSLLDMAKKERDWITAWAYAQNDRARKFYRREGFREVSREMDPTTKLIDVAHLWTRSA